MQPELEDLAILLSSVEGFPPVGTIVLQPYRDTDFVGSVTNDRVRENTGQYCLILPTAMVVKLAYTVVGAIGMRVLDAALDVIKEYARTRRSNTRAIIIYDADGNEIKKVRLDGR